MAIVNEYNNTTAIYHGGVSYSSVYKNLVQYFPDPRTPPWPPEEKIEIEVEADSNWNIYIPTNNVYQDSYRISYDWSISIDNWSWVRYNWYVYEGSSRQKITISWYTPSQVYNIKIKSYSNPTYWWAKAFNYRNDNSIVGTLKSIIYDNSYMWYADSATSTWDYFRAWQYQWCSSITSIPAENIPSTVVNIWSYFRHYQYYWCSWITSVSNEIMPPTVNSIWTNFREYQYWFCTSLTTPASEVMPSWSYNIPNSFRYGQYRNSGLTTPAEEALPSTITVIWDNFRGSQYMNCTSLTYTPIEVLPNTVNSIWSYFRYYQYYWCSSVTEVKGIIDRNVWTPSNYRRGRLWASYLNSVKVFSDVWPWWAYNSSWDWFYRDAVTQILVPSAYLQNFIDSNNYPRRFITDSKFIWY